MVERINPHPITLLSPHLRFKWNISNCNPKFRLSHANPPVSKALSPLTPKRFVSFGESLGKVVGAVWRIMTRCTAESTLNANPLRDRHSKRPSGTLPHISEIGPAPDDFCPSDFPLRDSRSPYPSHHRPESHREPAC